MKKNQWDYGAIDSDCFATLKSPTGLYELRWNVKAAAEPNRRFWELYRNGVLIKEKRLPASKLMEIVDDLTDVAPIVDLEDL
jgi:hypothetical protein